MCRINFQETFRINVGLPDFSKKRCFCLMFFLYKVRFSKITFFRKASETNILPKSFLKIDSANFSIQIDLC